MFRQWTLKYKINSIEKIFKEETFLDLLLKQVENEVIYQIDDSCIFQEENNYEYSLINSKNITNTGKEQLMKIRIGQGEFENKLIQKESKCKICSLENEKFLISSRIKPWSISND